MIQDAIDALVGVGKEIIEASDKANVARKIELPGDGRSVMFERNGTFIKQDIPPANRAHTVATVQDLIDASKRWTKDNVIWLSSSSAILVLDDADRREKVTLPLREGKTFSFLRGLSKGGSFDQPAMIRCLRTDLVNAGNRAAILTAVRKIKFRSLSAGTSDLQHGNESMGQQIENEVTGAGDVPEQLTVDTHVFSNLGERDSVFTVLLDLEIDAANKRFVLKPVGDEIERVSQAALETIAERIRDSLPAIPVFFGEP